MRVRELMAPQPQVLPAATPVAEAAGLLRACTTGEVVVSDGGRWCGIVSEQDILGALAQLADLSGVVLGDLCGHDLQTVDAEADVREVAAIMRREGHRLLGVTSDGQVVGILRAVDLDRSPP
jgi:CBS domain-containing protein